MANIQIKGKHVDVDLLQLMKDYGIRGKVIGNEYLAHCPFHEDVKSPSFSIKLEGEKAGLWQCFSPDCESKGNIVKLIMLMENCDYREAIASLVAVEDETVVEEKDLDGLVKKLLNVGIDISQKSLRYPIPEGCTKSYVEPYFTMPKSEGGRGYSKEDFVQLSEDIWYCESGFFRNKIIIPIYNESGEQISFVARILDSQAEEKFRYPRGWKKNRFVYRLDADSDEPPVVCEGIFDGLHIQGIWNRTALIGFGSSLTTIQIAWIARRYDKVTLGLDGDKAGRSGAYKAVKSFQQFGTEVDVLQLPDGLDPPCISRMDLRNLQLMAAKDYGEQWEKSLMSRKFSRSGNQG